MSTGGPPAGVHTGGNKGDGGLMNKLKGAIKPSSSTAKSDGADLPGAPGGAAHEDDDRGGSGILNALKPGTDNAEGNPTLDAAREATQSLKGDMSNSMPAGASAFKSGLPGGPGTQGA
ncbi:hypothetical protein PG994_002351 [Apiospora phragmitis]|uniref:Uncharacterized protein n=1 Tax=Apiospora phragmitis TaxID=2905665 RepID=A0ABR1WWA6_9PEZI